VSAYHRLSIAAKQALHRKQMRESSVTCPSCETHTMAGELLEHMAERCLGPEGRPEPHAGAQWISWRQAMRLGVPRWTLSRWAQAGEVRFLGERQDRKYLMRDVAIRMAQRKADRRR
jgi:hypothetical protein